MSARESGQVRKEAALSGHRYAQRGFPCRSCRRRKRLGTSSRLRVHGPLRPAAARGVAAQRLTAIFCVLVRRSVPERRSVCRRRVTRERLRSARLAFVVSVTVSVLVPAPARELWPRPIVTALRPLPRPNRRAERAASVRRPEIVHARTHWKRTRRLLPRRLLSFKRLGTATAPIGDGCCCGGCCGCGCGAGGLVAWIALRSQALSAGAPIRT